VVDGYAGTGDTAARLAAAGVRVTALELDADATAVSARRLPPGSRAVAGRVEDTLGAALPADVVIVNPPRAGLHERVPAVLEGAGSGHRALVYVSCNPATLARDLARMPGHEVVALRSFDMFPQTAHVETVCELVRRTP
jgi:23S rRNA (uracil1939-C5)-methyltransferase